MKLYLYTLSILFLLQCTKKLEIDKSLPVITINENSSPNICQKLYIGDKLFVKYEVSDNNALRGYSLNVHNNFDHHSHSTEKEECPLEENKKAINPWKYNYVQNLPERKSFIIVKEIAIPNDIDTGDYDFVIRVTDKGGFEAIKVVPIKLMIKE